MIIEFVGVPGSGKTYLAHQLHKKLSSEARLVSHDQSEKVSLIKFFKLIFRLDIFIHLILFYCSFESKPKGSFWRLMKAPKFSCFEISSSETLIRDQGLIQWIWSALVGVESYSQPRLKKILQLLHPANTVLIFVHVDEQIGFQRLLTRGKNYSRFDGLSSDQLEILAKKEWPKLRAIAELATKNLIEFDNSKEGEDFIDELARKVVP